MSISNDYISITFKCCVFLTFVKKITTCIIFNLIIIMGKVKELLTKDNCHILSIEELKAIKGGLIFCNCGNGTFYFAETVAECEKLCEKMQLS